MCTEMWHRWLIRCYRWCSVSHMPRPPDDPSGAKVHLCIRLSPDHLARLDRAAKALNLNRSKTIANLIDRTVKPEPKDPT